MRAINGLAPLGIGLDHCRIDGDVACDKDEQVGEQFERLLGRNGPVSRRKPIW
jgi:hypothetical protein